MRNYTVSFPERVIPGETTPACSCQMVSCGSHAAKRGVATTILGNSRAEVWDRMKQLYPFEKIVVS